MLLSLLGLYTFFFFFFFFFFGYHSFVFIVYFQRVMQMCTVHLELCLEWPEMVICLSFSLDLIDLELPTCEFLFLIQRIKKFITSLFY
jgi:hypothetical protein